MKIRQYLEAQMGALKLKREAYGFITTSDFLTFALKLNVLVDVELISKEFCIDLLSEIEEDVK